MKAQANQRGIGKKNSRSTPDAINTKGKKKVGPTAKKAKAKKISNGGMIGLSSMPLVTLYA